MKKAIVVNFVGAPGAGKSTGAAYIFSKLKMAGVNAEYVSEFAKDKVWEETKVVFEHQEYIFGKQSYKIGRCADKVDVIITDSPLILSAYYNKDEVLGETFNKMVMNVFNSYDNVVYFVNRIKKYNPSGRLQTEAESDKIRDEVLTFLRDNDIKYVKIDGCIEEYNDVVHNILSLLRML